MRQMIGGLPVNRLPAPLPWNQKLKNTNKFPDG
ncbi:hypothetical protein CCP2SC5_1300006 [Azospirillaceae bacterium]